MPRTITKQVSNSEGNRRNMYPELANHQQVVKSEVRHFEAESLLSPKSVVRAMPIGGLPPMRPSREARWSGSESSNDTNGPPVFRGSPAPSDGRKKLAARSKSPKRSTTSSDGPTPSRVRGFSDSLDPSMDSFSLGEDDDIFDESDKSGHSRSSGRSKRANSRGRKARKGVLKMMTNKSNHTHNSSMSSITMALGSSVDFTFEDSLATIDFSGHLRSTSQHQPMMMSTSESRWNPAAQKASEMGLATPARARRFSSQSLLPTLASLAGFDPESSQDISINDSIAEICSSLLPTTSTPESSSEPSTTDRCETVSQDCIEVQNNDESIVLRDFELSAQELEEESLPPRAPDVDTAQIADTPRVAVQSLPSVPSPVPSSPASKHSRSSSHRRRGSLGIFGNRYNKHSSEASSSSDDYDAFLQAGAPGDFATWQAARQREREIPPLANSSSRPTWTASNNVLFSESRKSKRRGSTGTLMKRLMSPSCCGDLPLQRETAISNSVLPKEDQFSVRTEHGTSCTKADGKCDFESIEGEMPLFGEMDLAKEEEESPKIKPGPKVRRRRSIGTLSNSGSSKATSSMESATEHSASTATTCDSKPKKKSSKAKRRQSTGDESCGSTRSKKSSKSKSRRKKSGDKNTDQLSVDGTSNHSLSTTSSHQLAGEGSQESLSPAGGTSTNRRSMMKKKTSKWDILVDKSSKRSSKPKNKSKKAIGDDSSLCSVSKKKKSPKERLLDIAPVVAPGIAVQV